MTTTERTTISDVTHGRTYPNRELVEAAISDLEDLIEDGEADEDDRADLEALREFNDECASACADWFYGDSVIPDREFETYARDLAEDIGAIPSDYSWPASHIDWTAAAEALQQDYTPVDLDGVTFWGRS